VAGMHQENGQESGDQSLPTAKVVCNHSVGNKKNLLFAWVIS